MSEHAPRAERAKRNTAFAKSDDDVGSMRAMREQLKIGDARPALSVSARG